MIPLLNNLKYLSVTTIGLRNALLLSQTNNIKIYIAGGQISNHSNSITGSDTIDYISRIHADVAFISCSGTDINSGFTDADIEQSKLKQQMRKNSAVVAMLCDSTKFGKTFMCTDFKFDEIDYLITDKKPPENYYKKITEAGCNVLAPEESIFDKKRFTATDFARSLFFCERKPFRGSRFRLRAHALFFALQFFAFFIIRIHFRL